jgi:hypothetical protein
MTLVRSPGFEPGLSAWEAGVLTKLDYDRSFSEEFSPAEFATVVSRPLFLALVVHSI